MNRLPAYIFFVFMLCLDVFPWPPVVALLIPPMTLLAIAYWAIHAPNLIGMGTGFVFSVLLDIILDTALGHHAVGYIVVLYVLIKFHRRMRINPVWQQSILMALAIFVERIIFFWISLSLGGALFDAYFLVCSISVLFIWPVVFWLSGKIQRGFHLY